LNDWEKNLHLMADGVEGEADVQDEVINEPTDEENEYFVEGSEEASNVGESKSREDIMAELAETREKLVALEAGAAPVNALQSTMEKMMSNLSPAKTPRKDGATTISGYSGPRMSDVDFEKHINQLMLENPYQAQQEAQNRMMEPLLQTVAVNQSQVSRELLLGNAENKRIYDKYGDEIEDAVAAMPMIDRVKNPRVYQTVLATVKAAHADELGSEAITAQVDAAVKAALAQYGIDPSKPATKSTTTAYNAPQSVSSRPSATTSTTKRQIVVPQWVAQEARIKGLDAGFLYERYKSQGKVK